MPLRHRPRRRGAGAAGRGYKAIVAKETGKPFPQDPKEQLWGAIGAVFGSWETPRAVTYRRLHNIPSTHGHRRQRAGDGLRQHGRRLRHRRRLHPRSRRPARRRLRRVPDQRPGRGRRRRHPHAPAAQQGHGRQRRRCRRSSMEEVLPATFEELARSSTGSKRHYRDMQDIEFTIQQRPALHAADPQRQAHGPGRAQGSPSTWHERADHARRRRCCGSSPASLDQLLHPTLDPKAERKVIAKGLPASPGAVSGKVVFSADDAEKRAEAAARP